MTSRMAVELANEVAQTCTRQLPYHDAWLLSLSLLSEASWFPTSFPAVHRKGDAAPLQATKDARVFPSFLENDASGVASRADLDVLEEADCKVVRW
jgi:hypothetical protein